MRKDTSAGCCVTKEQNGNTYILLIQGKSKEGKTFFFLPKGHREGDESLEQAALRETTEETGFSNIEIIRYIGSQNYILDMDNGIDKTDHYYHARLKSKNKTNQILTYSEKERKMKNKWVSLKEAIDLLEWQNEKEIVQELI